MSFYPKPTKLIDCAGAQPIRAARSAADPASPRRESAVELFLVEGDSACKAVARSRHPQHQAVLAMQGKPMNAIKAGRKSIENNDLLRALIDSLGAGWGDDFEIDQLRYGRVILLFDPDADGIHCGALMMMFFHRWMPALIQTQRLSLVRPPLYEIVSPELAESIHAYSDEHCRKVRDVLDQKEITYQARRFRGLANLDPSTLQQTCLDKATRREEIIQIADALAAIEIFGGAGRGGQ